ncbi:cytochrome b [Halomonas caseinilytica]|uniref:Cytochrome b561 n=1 Tax=Halomonas caseinilytica TaxID=438744 RepID=A0A1M6VEQ5_9GAMM|nr:cytochrome b [Halomonas caseinilytica]SHK79929.1 cytochrome b561 [Halomonas caseinilytica]
MDTRMMDHDHGYGLVSRFFHWFMALLLLWQLISAALHFAFDEAPVTDFFFGFHFSNGVLLLCLALLRGIWGLLNLSRRPPHRRGIERLAALGHVLIYLLMIAVPTIALIRAYGSDHPFSALGMPLFAGQATEIEWMTNLGGQWHGLLGWGLFALVAGHIAMALVHTHVWKEPLIRRMTRGSDLP